jgi:hypothetical protein
MGLNMNIRTLALAAILAAGFTASAQAFTFEGSNGVANSDGSRSQLADPDRRFESGTLTGDNKRTLYDSGNGLKFEMYGSQAPSNAQQFNMQRERMFTPNLRD